MRPQMNAIAARTTISRSARRAILPPRPRRTATVSAADDSGEERLSSSRLMALGQSTANDDWRFRSGGGVFGFRRKIPVVRMRQCYKHDPNCNYRDRQKQNAALRAGHAA